MDDYDDIDLDDANAIDVQIVEREAVIDRLYGEIDALKSAAAKLDSAVHER